MAPAVPKDFRRVIIAASVWSSDADLFQYSFAELTSKIFGHVPLARQRRRRPSLCPVTGSVVTLQVNGKRISGYSRSRCWRMVRPGCAKR